MDNLANADRNNNNIFGALNNTLLSQAGMFKTIIEKA